MRNGTDKHKKKLVTIIITVVLLLFLALNIGVPVAVLWGYEPEDTVLLAMSAPMALTGAAFIVGIVAVLIQRLREIDRGEEDEARKY